MQLYTLPDGTILNLDRLVAVTKLTEISHITGEKQYTIHLIDFHYRMDNAELPREQFIKDIDPRIEVTEDLIEQWKQANAI